MIVFSLISLPLFSPSFSRLAHFPLFFSLPLLLNGAVVRYLPISFGRRYLNKYTLSACVFFANKVAYYRLSNVCHSFLAVLFPPFFVAYRTLPFNDEPGEQIACDLPSDMIKSARYLSRHSCIIIESCLASSCA